MTDRRANRRISFLLVAFGLLFGIVLARAAWIQVLNGSSYEAMASRQHRETIEIPAGRGTIFDRTGAPLAIGEQATTVYADPRNMTDPKRAAIEAAKAFDLDPNELYAQLRDRTTGFLYVKRKADPVQAAALEKLKIPGLGFYAEERRTYPQRSVASHVLGFAGTDNNGLEGIEQSLERQAGGPGRLRDDHPRPVRSPDRGRHVATGAAGPQREAHDRPRDPGRHRVDPVADGARLGRQGSDGDSDGHAHRSRPRDGERAHVRREPVRHGSMPLCGATARSRTCTSRARPSRSSRSRAPWRTVS